MSLLKLAPDNYIQQVGCQKMITAVDIKSHSQDFILSACILTNYA